MCFETSEAVGTTWEHAQLEFQKFLKIRITLLISDHTVVILNISYYQNFSVINIIFLTRKIINVR